MSIKHSGIDLMKLYSLGSANGWNEFLTDCYKKRDINRLSKVNYEIQVGMTAIVKNKLNTPELEIFFGRLTMSLEKTAFKIFKLKRSLSGDNPLIAKQYGVGALEDKRISDLKFRAWWKKNAY